MNLEFNNEEMDLLRELLDKELNELPVEIHHTKHYEFKEYLKERQKVVESLADRFKLVEMNR